MSGPGAVRIAGSESSPELAVVGRVAVTLPPDAIVTEHLNAERFRHMVAVERGPIPEPPASVTRAMGIECAEVEGLRYVAGFLSSSEERQLVAEIDSSEWQSNDIRRRVQHYGWRYDYRSSAIDTSMRLGPLAEWGCSHS